MKVARFMGQNDSSEANISKLVKELPGTSLTYLKLPATCPYSEPDDPPSTPSQTISAIPVLVIYSNRRLSLPSAFSFRISQQNFICVPLLPIHARLLP